MYYRPKAYEDTHLSTVTIGLSGHTCRALGESSTQFAQYLATVLRRRTSIAVRSTGTSISSLIQRFVILLLVGPKTSVRAFFDSTTNRYMEQVVFGVSAIPRNLPPLIIHDLCSS